MTTEQEVTTMLMGWISRIKNKLTSKGCKSIIDDTAPNRESYSAAPYGRLVEMGMIKEPPLISLGDLRRKTAMECQQDNAIQAHEREYHEKKPANKQWYSYCPTCEKGYSQAISKFDGVVLPRKDNIISALCPGGCGHRHTYRTIDFKDGIPVVV